MPGVTWALVTVFFPRYTREQLSTERQFLQIVGAVQLLLVDLVYHPSALEIEWNDWTSAWMQLASDCPTLLRTERLALTVWSSRHGGRS